MRTDCYLGMRPGDLDGKPYAKYWNPEMEALQDAAAQAILQGPVSPELGFDHKDAAQLLEPGYLPLETGYTRLPNGHVFVAVLTPMPGASAPMIDWWFAWHGAEKERYKLWHPKAHMRASCDESLSEVAGLSDREKYVGNISYVDEYIGNQYHQIAIAFRSPAQCHLDEARFEQAGVGTAVCARVGFTSGRVQFARIIHLIRETPTGCEMRSRFWLGDVALRAFDERSLVNRVLGSRMIARHAAPMQMGRDLLVHCAMEMRHLASFLPDLYRDYHSDDLMTGNKVATSAEGEVQAGGPGGLASRTTRSGSES